MILLGSIQRTELIGLIERHIGRERRLLIAAKRQKEARVRLVRNNILYLTFRFYLRLFFLNRMYEEAMTSLKIDPPAFSKVSLALPAPAADAATGSQPTADDQTKKAVVRRPSRFEVVKTTEMFDSLAIEEAPQSPVSTTSNDNDDVSHISFQSPICYLCYHFNDFVIQGAYVVSQPKSILKRTNSQTLKHAGPMAPPSLSPYSTVTGAEGR